MKLQLETIETNPQSLKSKSTEVVDFDYTLLEIIKQMHLIMRIYGGIGLAANQVGLQKRIIVLRKTPYQAINPTWKPLLKSKVISTEGCLSIPGKQYKVERYPKILAVYKDTQNKIKEIELSGIDSFCWQHECDHLDGILISDYVPKQEKT